MAQQREPVGTAAGRALLPVRVGFTASNQLAGAGGPAAGAVPRYLLEGRVAAGPGPAQQEDKRLTKIERGGCQGPEISMKPAAARAFPGLSETASLRV